MWKTHHPSSILSRWTITLIILVSGAAIVSGAVYVGKLPNSDVPESKSNGWSTPIASSKEISTPEWCKKIVSTLSTQMFIPTRSETEWNSFKSALPTWVRVEECSVWWSCWWQQVASPWWDCVGEGIPLLPSSYGPDYACTSAIHNNIVTYRSEEKCFRYYPNPQTYVNEWSWKCVCPAAPPPVVNGVCGSASGTTISAYPTSGHCSTGNKVDLDTTATDGTYNWRCDGSGWGNSPSCSATKKASSPWCNGGTIVNNKCQSGTPANNCNGAWYEPYCSCSSWVWGWFIGDGPFTCQTNWKCWGIDYCMVPSRMLTTGPACSEWTVVWASVNDTTRLWTWTCDGTLSDESCQAHAMPDTYLWMDCATTCDFGETYKFDPVTWIGTKIVKSSCFSPEYSRNQYIWNSITDQWTYSSFLWKTWWKNDNWYCNKPC